MVHLLCFMYYYMFIKYIVYLQVGNCRVQITVTSIQLATVEKKQNVICYLLLLYYYDYYFISTI